MASSESLADFYKRHSVEPEQSVHPHHKDAGKFNVYSREEFLCKAYSPYNRRDFYKISLIIGKGILYYADKAIEIDRTALLFSNPNVPYSWEATSEEQAGYFCLFTEGFISTGSRGSAFGDLPLFKIGGTPVYFITKEQEKNISDIFQKMQTELASDYLHKYDLLRNYIDLLIHEALKMRPAESYFEHSNASTRITSLFLELLERQFPIDSPEHILRLKTANDYASRLSLHVNHLNRSVKEVTGRTTTQHIADKIVNEAKALLLHTDWNIAEIGYSLGFEYPAYFNNFFKKQTQVTPRSLR